MTHSVEVKAIGSGKIRFTAPDYYGVKQTTLPVMEFITEKTNSNYCNRLLNQKTIRKKLFWMHPSDYIEEKQKGFITHARKRGEESRVSVDPNYCHG